MNYKTNWQFMLNHMPAVREALALLPAGYFLDFATADPKRDMEEATDLVLEISGGTMAVRIRRYKFYKFALQNNELNPKGLDWSIRYECRNSKTEIHKLREGFADWYFYGYSADDKSELAFWCLIDLYRVREEGILDMNWQISPNGDGTSGMYIPIYKLDELGTLISMSDDVFASATIASAWS